MNIATHLLLLYFAIGGGPPADTTLLPAMREAVSHALLHKRELVGRELLVDVESFRNGRGGTLEWSAPALTGRTDAAPRSRREAWECRPSAGLPEQCRPLGPGQAFLHSIEQQPNDSGLTILFDLSWTIRRGSDGRWATEGTTYRAELAGNGRDGWRLLQVRTVPPEAIDRLPPAMVEELRRRRQATDTGSRER